MRNKLLERQIQKYLGPQIDIPENYRKLLDAIDEYYNHQEKDRQMFERSIDISSNEMLELNNKLREETNELKKTQMELARVFNSVDEGLFSMDTTTGKYIHVSSACEKIYGYPLTDFYANGMLWYDVIHPEDKTIINQCDAEIKKGMRANVEYRIIHKNKNIRWLKASVIPILNDARQLVRIDGIVSDITESKEAQQLLHESEANLKAILNNANTGYVLLSTSLEVVANNPKMEEFSYKHLLDTLAIGKYFVDYFPEEERKSRLELIQTVLSGSHVSYDARYQNSDGSVTWYGIQMFNVPDGQNGSLGFTMAVTDITEKKLADIEIKSMNELLEKRVAERTAELERANKELESFSYTVSHDLRAPLRIINGYSKILLKAEKDNLGDESLQILDDIMGTAAHMGQLIDDLLNFSRLGRAALDKRSIDMNMKVKTIVDEVRHSLNGQCRANIELNNLEPVVCDPGLINQVWVNLISNAIKYSSKKHCPEVKIGSQESNGEVVYYVKDNGAGFDMQYYDKLFGVFQRLHKATEYEGTGVGLALVQRIIAKHGGRIWANAKVDEGATFYFTFS